MVVQETEVLLGMSVVVVVVVLVTWKQLSLLFHMQTSWADLSVLCKTCMEQKYTHYYLSSNYQNLPSSFIGKNQVVF